MGQMNIARGLALAAVLAAAAPGKTARFGLFVGHNLGQGREPLKFAEKDAERMAGIFRELGGVDSGNARVLRSPDRVSLERAFAELAAAALARPSGADAVFLFYFSGHGEERNLILGGETLPLDRLKERFDAFPAKLRIGVFDACQSGAITRIKGARRIEPFLQGPGTRGEGNIYITSSGGDENSQEADHLEGSYFTHHLASGLRGAADLSGDRRVTLMEAYQYAFNHTVVGTGGTRGGVQHPNARFRMDVEGDIVLTDFNSGSTGLRFGRAASGAFLVLDGKSNVMAEVHKDAKSDFLLALGPGDYRVVAKDRKTLREARLSLRHGETHTLDPDGMDPLPLPESKLKGWAERPEEEDSKEAAPTDPPGRIGLEAGYAFDRGSLLSGGLRYDPWGWLALRMGYAYRNYVGPVTEHTTSLGLEAYYPLRRRVLIFGGVHASAGRANDGFHYYRNQVEYTCPDWSTTEGRLNTCTYYEGAQERKTRTVLSEGLEAGARFVVYPRFSLHLKMGAAYQHNDRHLDSEVIGTGFHLQPYLIGADLLF